jgi:3-hydroxymyristoyl/3-hydroxydecanoyl-(acyl carrier protein) dehydratase
MLEQPTLLGSRRDSDDLAELEFLIPAALVYFADHFPGQPILPGVVQLGWAVTNSQRVFDITQPLRKVSLLKFQHPIRPEARMVLRLERKAAGALTQVNFSFSNATREYSSGRLSFADAGC